MVCRHLMIYAAIVLVCTMAISGCSEEKKDTPISDPALGEGASPESGENPKQDAVEQELAKLSPEDRALAEKQKICPVSEEPLGSMGAPLKLDVNGQVVFICCKACEEPLREDPDKYLAKNAEK